MCIHRCIDSTTAALPSLTDMMFVSKFYSSQDNVVGSEVVCVYRFYLSIYLSTYI